MRRAPMSQESMACLLLFRTWNRKSRTRNPMEPTLHSPQAAPPGAASIPAPSRRRVALRPGAQGAEGPGLPFWVVSLLVLGLPITLGGLLLALWIALFG